MEYFLKKCGFIKTNVPYEFKKGNSYTLVASRNGEFSLTHYSPKVHRFLWSVNFETENELKKSLGENNY